MIQAIWGWQPALYLFLGGMGAGAYVTAAALFLSDSQSHKRIVCVSMWAAAASVIIGLLLLLAELITPLRGLMMWQSFSNGSSWMTFGAWGAFCAIAVFVVSGFLALGFFDGKFLTFRKALAVFGIFLGLFVAVYTGMLLKSAPGVPLWNTPLLPMLFTVSALDTGVALVEMISIILAPKEEFMHAARKTLEICTIVLVVTESMIVALFSKAMLGADVTTQVGSAAVSSISMLLYGGLSRRFWSLFVTLGLAVPCIAAVICLFVGEKKAGFFCMAFGAICALIGGCELRFLILAAGTHADLFATVLVTL